jgi:hypothetical protein
MVQIPEQPFSLADISEWFKLKQELAALKTKEMLARVNVFKHTFGLNPDTKLEGTNNYELPDHYVLKAVTSLNRDLEIEVLRAIAEELHTKFNIVADDLVRWKPELNLPAYRELCKEHPEAAKFFDQCITAKPGTPQLDITLPKKFQGKGDLTPPSVSEQIKTPF